MRTAADFRATTRRGPHTGRSASGGLVVHVSVTQDPIPAPDVALGPALVGFVIPKAVGGAVVRNRVRRRLRALIASRLAQLPPGSRVVVRVTPPASVLPSATLAADLDAGLRRGLSAAARGSSARRPESVTT